MLVLGVPCLGLFFPAPGVGGGQGHTLSGSLSTWHPVCLFVGCLLGVGLLVNCIVVVCIFIFV